MRERGASIGRANRKDFWPKNMSVVTIKIMPENASRVPRAVGFRWSAPPRAAISSARNACERVGRARTPCPPPQTLSSPPARRHGAWSEPRAVQREESEEAAGWQQGQHGGPDPPGPSGEVRDAISRLVLSFPDTSARVASVRAERTCHAVGFARHASASRPGRSRSIEPRRRPFLSRLGERSIDQSSLARRRHPDTRTGRSRSASLTLRTRERTRPASSPSTETPPRWPLRKPRKTRRRQRRRPATTIARRRLRRWRTAESRAACGEERPKLDNFNPQLAKQAKNAGKTTTPRRDGEATRVSLGGVLNERGEGDRGGARRRGDDTMKWRLQTPFSCFQSRLIRIPNSLAFPAAPRPLPERLTRAADAHEAGARREAVAAVAVSGKRVSGVGAEGSRGRARPTSPRRVFWWGSEGARAGARIAETELRDPIARARASPRRRSPLSRRPWVRTCPLSA